MRLEPIAKPVRIRIKSGGIEHSSLTSLREHFVLEDLKDLIADGRLSRWLQQQGQESIPDEICQMDRDSDDFEDAVYRFFFEKDVPPNENVHYWLFQKTQQEQFLTLSVNEGCTEARAFYDKREREKAEERKRREEEEREKRHFFVGPTEKVIIAKGNAEDFNRMSNPTCRTEFPKNDILPIIKCQTGYWTLLTFAQWISLFKFNQTITDAWINSQRGVILLPYGWKSDKLQTDDNIYDRFQWEKMEQAGAIFLPDMTYYLTKNTKAIYIRNNEIIQTEFYEGCVRLVQFIE